MTPKQNSEHWVNDVFRRTTTALAVLTPIRQHREPVDFEWVELNDATRTLVSGAEPGASVCASLPTVGPLLTQKLAALVRRQTERVQHQFQLQNEGGLRWVRCEATWSGAQVVASFLDTTTERALRQESALLTSIYEQAPFAACFVGGDPAEFEFANDAFVELCGVGPLLGRRVADVTSTNDAPSQVLNLLLQVRGSGRRGALPEFEVTDNSGRSRYLRIVAQPVEETPGDATSVQLIAADVTASVQSRLEAEELASQLAEAKSSLEESSRSKDEFLAMLGHELRNPLSALRHASVVLSELGVPDEARPIVGIVDRQTKQMGRLVDDLLDVGRIARGKFDFRAEKVDMRQIVSFALDDLEAARLATQELHPNLQEGPIWVDGDSARLLQACQNILNNAVKYTPEDGLIRISLEQTDDWVIFQVSDNGVGLDASFQAKLFRPFEQAPQDLSRSQGGLGLGLALTSQIVKHHGGSIEAESPGRGKGATFTIRVPRAKPLGAQEVRLQAEPRRRLRFLIVEDNRDAAELLELLLTSRGHEVAVCHSGDRAFDAALGYLPDVVLCDLGLPGLSGFEVAERIRKESQLDATVLIALTGYGRQEDISRSKDAGFSAHLTKPADVDEIFRLLQELGVTGDSPGPD